jgi:hypothetical protein
LPIFQNLTKGNIVFSGGEATPVLWQGQIIYVAVGPYPTGYTIEIRDESGALLSSSPSGWEYIGAFVDSGTLYVTGVEVGTRKALLITQTTDLVTWSQPRVVISQPDGMYFNSSITRGSNGFVIAYEYCDNETASYCFQSGFLQTQDFVNWTPVGSHMMTGYYTACPTLRYSNGYYYNFVTVWIPETPNYVQYWTTYVFRSNDLNSWELGKYQVLSPRDGSEGAPNASDLDFIEHNGVLKMIYLNTPQNREPVTGPVGARYAEFNGSFDQFVQELFQ